MERNGMRDELNVYVLIYANNAALVENPNDMLWLVDSGVGRNCLTDYMIQQIIDLRVGLFDGNNEANDRKLYMNGKNWGERWICVPGQMFSKMGKWNSKPCRCWLKVSG